MRILFSSTRGTGHFTPLVPVIEAALRQGHEVLVAGPPDLAEATAARGYGFWQFDPPPEDELDEVWSKVPALGPEEGNAVVIGEIFGRLDTTAALPRMQEAVAEWKPEVVVREMSEYSAALAGEAAGVPVARVGIGLAALEEESFSLVAGALGDLRRRLGFSPDPESEVLRSSLYLTAFPQTLEDPDARPQPRTFRFSDPTWGGVPAGLPDWWDNDSDPFVYISFGTVAGNTPMAGGVYGAAIEAAGDLPVRALVTVGREVDTERFGAPPSNVRIEQWVPQADVLGHAAAVMCHGGSGSTLGALAAGRPLVVVPLFADQPQNAERVAAVGAGLLAVPDRDQIRAALEQILQDDAFRDAAAGLAAELHAQPPADAAIEVLEGLPD